MPLIASKRSEQSSQGYQKLPLLVNRFDSNVELNPLPWCSFEISILTEQVSEVMEIDKEIGQETSLFSVLRKLEKFYIFKNTEEIVAFIGTHVFLLDILFRIPKWIESLFGNSVKIHLELHKDPEENFEGLFIIIKTNLSPEESLNLLDRLDEEWWLDVDNDISNILEIMVRPT